MFDKKTIKTIFLLILLVETVSLVVHLLPTLMPVAFALLCLIFLYFSFKDLKYGVYFVLVELILGSKGGYLFYLDINGSLLSIRMAFWAMLLIAWFVKHFIPIIIKKQTGRIFPIEYEWFKYFGILLFFVLWGLASSFLNGNSLNNIFFDFNAYLYFLLIFPLTSILNEESSQKNKEILSSLLQIFCTTTTWVSLKTLLILFLFSHKLEFLSSVLYSWVRKSGVGEITQMEGGFYRVFFQSHIFTLVLLIAFIIILLIRISKNNGKTLVNMKDKSFLFIFAITTILSASVIVSMSRSNWVGFIVATLVGFVYIAWRFRLRGIVTAMLLTFVLFIISYALVISLVKFPYPKPIGGFEAGDILSERASEMTNEAGASSRWNLLPELYNKIKEAPILGSGFGATVTYVSNDPRVRNVSKDGIYTTYAFEWGWLDIWIKLGFLGFVAYLILLFKISINALRLGIVNKFQNQEAYIIIILAIFCLTAINFFSPYLNHPLGIGLVLYSILFMESLINSQKNELNHIKG